MMAALMLSGAPFQVLMGFGYPLSTVRVFSLKR